MPVIIRPCKTKAGFEALPARDGTGEWDHTMKLDLIVLSERLQGLGYEVLEAGVLLVVAHPEMPEITLYTSGRLIIKADGETSAERAAKRLYRDIGLEP